MILFYYPQKLVWSKLISPRQQPKELLYLSLSLFPLSLSNISSYEDPSPSPSLSLTITHTYTQTHTHTHYHTHTCTHTHITHKHTHLRNQIRIPLQNLIFSICRARLSAAASYLFCLEARTACSVTECLSANKQTLHWQSNEQYRDTWTWMMSNGVY